MNGVVSKFNKKFISHLTRAKRTPSVAETTHMQCIVILGDTENNKYRKWKLLLSGGQGGGTQAGEVKKMSALEEEETRTVLNINLYSV